MTTWVQGGGGWSRRTAAVVVLATLAVTTTAVPALARQRHAGVLHDLCRNRQHLLVHDVGGTRYVVKNDNYGGQLECLTVQGRSPNFTVAVSTAASRNNEPVAYPYIMRGCSWGTCSPGSGLPARVSALGTPSATWQTSQHASGKWDAAFDIWFSKQPMITGQARSEIMIWLNARRIPVAKHTKVVSLDHTRWYLLHWRACHGGACWHYTQFRRVVPVTGVHGLRLGPFFQLAESRKWVKSSWWLEGIEAGFELWNGGTGLATDSFWARG